MLLETPNNRVIADILRQLEPDGYPGEQLIQHDIPVKVLINILVAGIRLHQTLGQGRSQG